MSRLPKGFLTAPLFWDLVRETRKQKNSLCWRKKQNQLPHEWTKNPRGRENKNTLELLEKKKPTHTTHNTTHSVFFFWEAKFDFAHSEIFPLKKKRKSNCPLTKLPSFSHQQQGLFFFLRCSLAKTNKQTMAWERRRKKKREGIFTNAAPQR